MVVSAGNVHGISVSSSDEQSTSVPKHSHTSHTGSVKQPNTAVGA